MKLAFIYAGQGSQKVGMGKDFYDTYPLVKSTYDAVDPENKWKELSFYGSLEELSDTQNTQPCMVAFAIAVTKLLHESGIDPRLVAGLSLGEYSALYCAGALEEKTAVDLVAHRGKFMAESIEGLDTKMSAILGCDRDVIFDCCKVASAHGIVEVANLNCPGQTVIGGERFAVEAAEALLKEKGARRCMELNVSGPFHTSLMEKASELLAQQLDKTNITPMKIPVIFNTTAQPLAENQSIKEMLTMQVKQSVLFEDTIKYFSQQGIDTIIEIGPGKVLSTFVKKTDSSIKCYQIEDVPTFEQVVSKLKGE